MVLRPFLVAIGEVQIHRELVPLVEVERRGLVRHFARGPRDVPLRVRDRTRPLRERQRVGEIAGDVVDRSQREAEIDALQSREVGVAEGGEAIWLRWNVLHLHQVPHVLVVDRQVHLGHLAQLVGHSDFIGGGELGLEVGIPERDVVPALAHLVVEEAIRDVQVLQIRLLIELPPVHVEDGAVRHREAHSQTGAHAAVGLRLREVVLGQHVVGPERRVHALQGLRVHVEIVVADSGIHDESAALVLVLEVRRRGEGLTRSVERIELALLTQLVESVGVDVELAGRVIRREAQLVAIHLHATLQLVILGDLRGRVSTEREVLRLAPQIVVPQGARRSRAGGERVGERIARCPGEAREEPGDVVAELRASVRRVRWNVVEEQTVAAPTLGLEERDAEIVEGRRAQGLLEQPRIGLVLVLVARRVR